MIHSSDAYLDSVSTGTTWCVHALMLLVHVEVGIWILHLAHIWTLLLQAQLLSSVGVSALCASTVLALQTSHGEIVEVRILYIAVL